jgi:hypothetical protein
VAILAELPEHGRWQICWKQFFRCFPRAKSARKLSGYQKVMRILQNARGGRRYILLVIAATWGIPGGVRATGVDEGACGGVVSLPAVLEQIHDPELRSRVAQITDGRGAHAKLLRLLTSGSLDDVGALLRNTEAGRALEESRNWTGLFGEETNRKVVIPLAGERTFNLWLGAAQRKDVETPQQWRIRVAEKVGRLAEEVERHHRRNFASYIEGEDDFGLSSAGEITLDQRDVTERTLTAARTAYDIRRTTKTLDSFGEDGAAKITRLSDAWVKTVESRYVKHNAKAREIIFREPVPLPDWTYLAGSIADFIVSRRFQTTDHHWWTDSDFFQSQVTADTSKSPLRLVHGERAFRKMFWPAFRPEYLGQHLIPDLSRFRVAINYDRNGIERSAEVMAKDERNEWQPFFFEAVHLARNVYWLPALSVRGFPMPQACAVCHLDEDGKFTPLARQARTAAGLRAVGFTDRLLIEAMLRR